MLIAMFVLGSLFGGTLHAIIVRIPAANDYCGKAWRASLAR
jgi:hypothetical protein